MSKQTSPLLGNFFLSILEPSLTDDEVWDIENSEELYFPIFCTFVEKSKIIDCDFPYGIYHLPTKGRFFILKSTEEKFLQTHPLPTHSLPSC